MSPVFDKVYQDAYLPFSRDKIGLRSRWIKAHSRCANSCCAKRAKPIRAVRRWPISRRWPARGGADAHPAARLRHQRTENRLPDRLYGVHSVPDYRPVVASVLMALGMMMVLPATISLPFKLMLFVLVDGWQLLLGSLAQSFYS